MIRLLTLLFLLAATPAGAQSVADYYHTAAQAYIDGQNAEAEQTAVAGLNIDPTDAKLQALLEKIRERTPDDSGGEQEQENADQQQDGEGEQQQDAQSDDEEQDAEPGEQNQRPEGEQQPEEPSEPQNEQQGDAGAEGEQQPQNPQGGGTQSAPFEVKPGEMSRAEAERILRAIESDELELLREVQRRRARPRYVEKDW